jgi:hypothetical protein
MITFFLLIVLACWSWFGYGPRFLRWPAVVLLILMSSGHPLGRELSGAVEPITLSLLPLAIVLLGIWIMVRGVFSRRSWRRPDWRRDDYERGRRRWNERW